VTRLILNNMCKEGFVAYFNALNRIVLAETIKTTKIITHVLTEMLT